MAWEAEGAPKDLKASAYKSPSDKEKTPRSCTNKGRPWEIKNPYAPESIESLGAFRAWDLDWKNKHLRPHTAQIRAKCPLGIGARRHDKDKRETNLKRREENRIEEKRREEKRREETRGEAEIGEEKRREEKRKEGDRREQKQEQIMEQKEREG